MSNDPNEVTPERATMLAMHAIHVQGGVSDPEREAERARQQLAQSPGSIDWVKMANEVLEAGQRRDAEQKQKAAAEAPPVTLDVALLPAESRIAQLYQQYPAAKAAADAAAERLKQITDGIKAELATAAPEVRKVELRGAGGQPLRYAKQVSMRFNSKRFIKASPANAAAYESFKDPVESWVLSAIKDGE